MKPDHCKDCPLYEKGESYVPGEGPAEPKVLLLGEAPGREEAYHQRPFVGGSGRILNTLLRKAGVRRGDLHVTNIVRCRPPQNRAPTEQEIRYCMRAHDLETFLKGFNLVILAGGTALYAITGKTHITRWRGSVFVHKGIKVLPILHPAALMRVQQNIPIAIADLMKVGSEGWDSEWQAPRQDYYIGALPTELPTNIDALAFDVETNSLTPSRGSVTLLGLSSESGIAHVLEPEHISDPIVKSLLGNEQITKIGHNVMFDIGHMEAQGVPIKGPIFDTMIAHHLNLSDSPKDLGFVASLYTRIPYWKDQIKTNLKHYNATDADATYRIYETLAPTLKNQGMTRIFDTSMKLLPILQQMEDFGVAYDRLTQAKWKITLEKKIRQLEQSLIKAVGDPAFNWRSTKQLAHLLYTKMGFPAQYSKYSKKVTTNEDALESLHNLTGSKVIKALLQLRKLSKLSSTYFTPVYTPDGRVHARFLLHGTATGRLSSREPNLQNVPKGPTRAIYVPDPGCIFVAADYSQIELKISAILSEDTPFLEAFERGDDIHTITATDVFNIRASEVTDRQRMDAKMIVYGLSYGRGAPSLGKQLKISTAAAQSRIDNLFAAHPRWELWRKDLTKDGHKNGYLGNPFGRRRYFFGPSSTPQMYNYPPQSTAADIMHESMIHVSSELPKDAHLLMQVHDELVVQCPEELEKDVKECLRDNMERPIDVLGDYVFRVNVSSGTNWGEI